MPKKIGINLLKQRARQNVLNSEFHYISGFCMSNAGGFGVF
jgi:hypothetical protein